MMLRTLLFLAFFPFALSAQGIQFEHGAWKEALAKAQKEGKAVFLDAYTSWCGPCKMMSREVFPNETAGAFFNQHFVSIKLDMERGEGIDVSNQYRVWVYPTLLFVDSTGAVLHRAAGYHTPEALVELAQTALDPARNLAGMERQYAAGKRDKTFLLEYISVKSAAYDPEADQLANDYLRAQDNYGDPQHMDLIMGHTDDPHSKAFAYLLKNHAAFEEKYGKREVDVKIETVFETYLQQHQELSLEEIQQLYLSIYPEKGAELNSRYHMRYYQEKEDAENFVRSAIEHYQRYPTNDPDELHEAAWMLFTAKQDKPTLDIALQWVERSVGLQENYYNQYTRAKILHELGQPKAAKKAAKRALQLAKESGEDTQLLEEFLTSLGRNR